MQRRCGFGSWRPLVFGMFLVSSLDACETTQEPALAPTGRTADAAARLESLFIPVEPGEIATSTGMTRKDLIEADSLDETQARLLVYVPQLRYIDLERSAIREPLGVGELHRYASDVYLAEIHFFESDPAHLLIPARDSLAQDLRRWPVWADLQAGFEDYGVASSPFGALGYARFSPKPDQYCFTIRAQLDPVATGDGPPAGADEVLPPSGGLRGYHRLFRMYFCQTGFALSDESIAVILGGIGVVGANEPYPSYVTDPGAAS